MTKEEIKGNAIMLAKFLGWTRTDRFSHEYITPHYSSYIGVDGNMYDSRVFYPEDMKFHESWDWLMPVLAGILEICAKIDELERYHIIVDQIPQLNHTYDAAINFIKQYNDGSFRD